MVALILGQSNAANSGDGPRISVDSAFNLYDGKCYRAADPLLGATDGKANVFTRVAGIAISRGLYDSVVLASAAIGGESVAGFAPGGASHQQMMAKIAQAQSSGFTFTHVFWLQGESDAAAKTPPDIYSRDLERIVQAIRDAGVYAPIYIAKETRCGDTGPYEGIRSVQSANATLNLRAGPDLDVLGPEWRLDGCHFNASGLSRAAEMIVDSITR
jgi:lysophospholipase L1-like esterase